MYKLGDVVYSINNYKLVSGKIIGVTSTTVSINGKIEEQVSYRMSTNGEDGLDIYKFIIATDWLPADSIYSSEEEATQVLKGMVAERDRLIAKEKAEEEAQSKIYVENQLADLKKKYPKWDTIEDIENSLRQAIKDGVLEVKKYIIV